MIIQLHYTSRMIMILLKAAVFINIIIIIIVTYLTI